MSRAFLPYIQHGNADGPTAQNSPRDEFLRLWLGHPEQQRRGCVEDARLTAAALWLCQDMMRRQEAGTLRGDLHVDSLGRNANARVRAYYPLPVEYEDGLNYCESVAIADSGHYDVAFVLQMLLDSPSHHDHMVGAGWFGQQTRWGMAFVAPAWYCLVTAPEVARHA